MSAGKHSYHPSSKKLLFNTNGEQHKKITTEYKAVYQWTVENPVPVDTSASHLQYLYIREYHGGGGKILRVRISEFCCETVSERKGCKKQI